LSSEEKERKKANEKEKEREKEGETKITGSGITERKNNTTEEENRKEGEEKRREKRRTNQRCCCCYTRFEDLFQQRRQEGAEYVKIRTACDNQIQIAAVSEAAGHEWRQQSGIELKGNNQKKKSKRREENGLERRSRQKDAKITKPCPLHRHQRPHRGPREAIRNRHIR
jgi:hypothetical protein